ncbi:MAG TPA: hypothetical protein PLJ35_09915 [Anaerolineae bacterium]|nr:hypothetical protein [Anaerolineae bacterium]HOQ99121.1 hypothetical protein [Anaerolineae bacterium]HPL27888.1 hypothetical protein [Anaerolineae bacterium]
MTSYTIVDTFPAFLAWWQGTQSLPLAAQVASWAAEYMAPWPELLAMQQADYAAQGCDWREAAAARVFPHLAERLPVMRAAHAQLAAVAAPACRATMDALGWPAEVTLVFYVGIGCGAGWATRYEGRPAVLLGLESIAECSWSAPETLRGLVAHEVGHLPHADWRAAAGLAVGSGPFWQLYEEGFAQRAEHLALGRESWHMANGDWLAWCRERRAWLAAEFLRRAEAGEGGREFFGSWYSIEGHSQCGYYLGHEVVQALQAQMSLREIAVLADWEAGTRRALAGLAGTAG